MATVLEVMDKYTKQPVGVVTSKDIQSFAIFIRKAFPAQKFHLVGGAALQLMGSERLTKDLDIIFETQDGMNAVKHTLLQKDLHHELLFSGSGAYFGNNDSIYWSSVKIIAMDMHYSGQKERELPVLAPEFLHTLDVGSTSLSIAPPVYLLCTKLISWEAEFIKYLPVNPKVGSHSEDIKFLLRLIKSNKVQFETMTRSPPHWVDYKNANNDKFGLNMWNNAKKISVNYLNRVQGPADMKQELVATANTIFKEH